MWQSSFSRILSNCIPNILFLQSCNVSLSCTLVYHSWHRWAWKCCKIRLSWGILAPFALSWPRPGCSEETTWFSVNISPQFYETSKTDPKTLAPDYYFSQIPRLFWPFKNVHDWKQNERGKKVTFVFPSIRPGLRTTHQTHQKRGAWQGLTKPTGDIAPHPKALISWGIYLKAL